MFLRMLSMLLIAVAMLAAPLTLREGMAMAATPAPAAMHHGDGAMPGHCDEQDRPDQGKHGKAMGGNCCAATCIAVVAPMRAAELRTYHRLSERPASDVDRRGTLSEIATPPPRLS